MSKNSYFKTPNHTNLWLKLFIHHQSNAFFKDSSWSNFFIQGQLWSIVYNGAPVTVQSASMQCNHFGANGEFPMKF